MNRHDLDWLSLLAGLLFAGLGTAFLIDSFGTRSADVAWVLPIVLIVFGLAGVISTIARHNAIPAAVATPAPNVAPTTSAAPTTAPSLPGFGQELPENEEQLSEPGEGGERGEGGDDAEPSARD